jgi:hypothetical protein
MNLRNAAGGLTSRFAHLAGLRPAKVTAGDPPADDDKDKEKAAAKADGDDDDDKKSDEDEGKKPDASEGDDDKKPDEDDDDKKDYAKAAASAERARCAAIFAAPEAAVNLSLAAHLAFETDLTAKQAVGALRAGGQASTPRRGGLSDRMSTQPAAGIGTDPAGASGGKATEASQQASRILAAARAAGGKF